jgi:hypothetical protein
LPSGVGRVVPKTFSHSRKVRYLDDMEEVVPIAPDSPRSHTSAPKGAVQLERGYAVHRFVFRLFARREPSVQSDHFHR